MPKWSILASFWKPEACGQTVLPDRSVLIGQILVENATIQKFQCDILGYFQTMCLGNWSNGSFFTAISFAIAVLGVGHLFSRTFAIDKSKLAFLSCWVLLIIAEQRNVSWVMLELLSSLILAESCKHCCPPVCLCWEGRGVNESKFLFPFPF